jgi:RNA polymerase sigma factor (sigma-70 family)
MPSIDPDRGSDPGQRTPVTDHFEGTMSGWNEGNLEQSRAKVRFRIGLEIGFASSDLDDLVQEALTRFLLARRNHKVHRDAEAAFLNSVCRNMVFEHRRRLFRENDTNVAAQEPADARISAADRLLIRDAIQRSMARLSDRDQKILQAFYVEEQSKKSICLAFGLRDEQFRVVLCRAKGRFRAHYNSRPQMVAAPTGSEDVDAGAGGTVSRSAKCG